METIKVESVCKTYGNLKAVSNVILSVKRGEVLGLIGENGAGKSTLIECILGTEKCDCGAVSILGMDPQLNRKKLFEKVGVQFQESYYQDKITVKELCEVTQALYRQPLAYTNLLKQFDLLNKRKSQISELSGGQKQRLFMMLALIPNPEVLFLDELTTGLDARARLNVWQCLSDLKEKGLTIFLTSHFMEEVERLCDKICILKKGRCIFYGTVQEAIKESPFEKLEEAYLWYTEEKEKVDYESI
ncbi:MAG: ABC transporter ATP-binding protein [Cellulosilyticaceae bacterium]